MRNVVTRFQLEVWKMRIHSQTVGGILHTAIVMLLLAFHPAMACSQTDETEDLYQLGTVHYSRGQFRFAAQRFQKIVDTGTNEALVELSRFYLAESLVPLGDYKNARTNLAEFISRNPNHQFATQASYRMGEVCYLTGDNEIAAKHLQQFASKNPQHTLLEFAYPYLAEIKLRSGDFQAAERFFELALAKHPNGKLANESRFGLARALEKLGEVDEAMRFYQLLINRPESGRVPDSLLQLGKIHFKRNQFPAAKKTFAKFETQYRDNELIQPIRYWSGRTAYELADYKAANQFFETALRSNPTRKIIPALHYEFARSLSQENRYAEALVNLDIVFTDFRDSDWGDDALLLKIQILRNSQQFELVVSNCETFRETYQQSDLIANSLDNEAAARISLEHYDKAEAILAHLISNHTPNELTSKEAQASYETWKYRLALTQLRQGRQSEALSMLEQINVDIAENATRSATLLARASIQIKQNRLADATTSLESFLDIANSSENLANKTSSTEANNAATNLALIYAKRQNMQSAESCANRIVGSQRKIQTLLQLAEIAFAAKQFRYAAEWFSRVASKTDDKTQKSKAMLGYIWSQKELGNIESTLVGVDRLIQSFPDSDEAADALYLKAVLLEKADNHLDAAKAYENLLANDLKNKHAEKAVLALTNLYRKNTPDKLKTLTPIYAQLIASTQSQQEDLLLYELAWIHFDDNNKELATQCFGRIHRHFKQSKHWPEATLKLAHQKTEENKTDRSEQLLSSILKNSKDRNALATSTFELAKIAFDKKEYLRAAKLFRTIVDRFSENKISKLAVYWAAEANYLIEKLDVAGQQFEAIAVDARLGQHKKSHQILMRRAQVAAKQKNWSAAIELATELLDFDPNWKEIHEAHYVLGRSYAGLGQFTKSRTAFQNVLDSEPATGTETAAMAQWMIGESHFHQDAYEEAIDAYQRTEILHAYPQWQAAALLQIGKCFELLKQDNHAIESYQRILQDHNKTMFTAEANERINELQNRTSAEIKPTVLK